MTADIENQRAMALEADGELDAAMRGYEAALGLDPYHAPSLLNYASLLLTVGRVSQARGFISRVLDREPDGAVALELMAHVYLNEGRPAAAVDLFQKLGLLDDACFHSLNLPVDCRPIHKSRALRVGLPSPRPPLRSHPPLPIRVGFICHPSRTIYRFFLPILRNLKRVISFCYWDGELQHPDRKDVEAASRFFWTREQDDVRLAERIRSDEIDVLVNLKADRLGTHLEWPCPLQYSMIGYPHSIGVDGVRAMITPWAVDPDREIERIVMPPSLKNGHITFGVMNRAAKFNDSIIGGWAKILDRVPTARLRVLSRGGPENVGLADTLMRAGVPQGRIDLVPMGTPAVYRELVRGCDIMLDTAPYSGTTTTIDALACGVPVVTLFGPEMRGQVSGRMLIQMGFGDLIARSFGEYITKAIDLTKSPENLIGYRNGLPIALRERLEGGRAAEIIEQRWIDDACLVANESAFSASLLPAYPPESSGPFPASS